MSRPFSQALGVSLLLATLVACGGGTHISNTSSVSAEISSVTLSCTPATLTVDATTQCAATVTGTGNYSSAVNWSASAGTVNANGVFTAPASAGTATVTATSMQDPVISGATSVTVESSSSPPPTISSVQVACNPSTVSPGATSQCAATVKGTGNFSSAVTWSASVGAVNASGLFTAAGTAGAATVTATSVQDTTQTGQATVTVQSQAVQSKHIVMVVEENSDYGSVVRNSNWPHLNNLISNGALATHYYANTHPSIGNYFMLTTGQLLTNTDSSTKVWNVDNLARRMLAANVSFRIYVESVPQGYVGGNTGLYVIRHNPFAMLSDIAGNPDVAQQHLWPFTQFAADLASGTLPEFSFIVPNIDDDAHTGSPQQADSWLQSNVVNRLSNDPAFQSGGDGVLIVDFDEAATSDSTHGGGHIPCVFWGPTVQVGFTQSSSTVYQHQSMLRTIMDTLGLPNPPGAAAGAPSMSEFFLK